MSAKLLKNMNHDPNRNSLSNYSVDHLLSACPVSMVKIKDLHCFENHPFSIGPDESLAELTESIKANGVINPILVWKTEIDDGTEKLTILSGHRRSRASELAGKKEIPAYVLTDIDVDTATVIMAHSNIQRENIKPSEKAKSYTMAYAAIKHQGTKDGSGSSLKQLQETMGGSPSQIQRYMSLTRLCPEAMEMVDNGKIRLTKAFELAKLPYEEQKGRLEGTIPLKKSDGELRFTIKNANIQNVFPDGTSKKEAQETLIGFLSQKSILDSLKHFIEDPNKQTKGGEIL